MESVKDKDQSAEPEDEKKENIPPAKPLPEHMYSREQLMSLKDAVASNILPSVLSQDFFGKLDLWDPELWFKSMREEDNSRSSSPMSDGKPHKRISDLDLLKRRRPSLADRLKEEEQDSIVLSPQRRSFGTGCHVTQQNPSPQQKTQSASEGREALSRRGGRIGSGRLVLDQENERDRGDYHSVAKDPTDSGNWRHRAERFRRDSGGEYYNNNHNSDRRFNHRNYGRSYREEAEPEWFTEGPVSRTDTIELHGFDGPDQAHDSQEHDSLTKEPENLTVSERNGSLETNISSSPESLQNSLAGVRHSPEGHSMQEFDFNDFLQKMDIPGLPDNSHVEEMEPKASGSGSRFSHWFSQSRRDKSRETSRRSSLNDEFRYLPDQMVTSRSPIPSPHGRTPSPQVLSSMQQLQQSNDIMAFLRQGQKQTIPSTNMVESNKVKDLESVFITNATTKQVEANLKALLLSGGKTPDSQSTTELCVMSNLPPTVPSGKFTTVAELEAASLKERSRAESQVHAQVPSVESNSTQDMAAFNKFVGLMQGTGALQEQPQMPVLSNSRLSPSQQISLAYQQAQQQKMLQELANSKHQQMLFQQKQQQQMVIQQQHHQQQQMGVSATQQQIQQTLSARREREVILGLLGQKQNPCIVTKSPSPANQMVHSQSPQTLIQHALLQHKQPSTPKAPSPIMFGTQPPVHAAAPSPIHPAQLQQTVGVTQSANTLQANPVIQRVPSPQELVIHTQAILQNALIKKQLEDQKERFLKRQHGMSPNLVTSTPTPPAQKHAVPVAFTPTSVIRKTAYDKVDEKAKQKDSNSNGSSPARSAPVQNIQKQIEAERTAGNGEQLSNDPQKSGGRPLTGQRNNIIAGNNVFASNQTGRPVMKGSENSPTGASSMRPIMGVSNGANLSPSSQPQRPNQNIQNEEIAKLVEQQRLMQQQGHPQALEMGNLIDHIRLQRQIHDIASKGNIQQAAELTKLVEQQRHQQMNTIQAQQRQMAGAVNPASGGPIPGIHMHSAGGIPINNPLMMQRMMNPAINTGARGMPQVNALNQQQMSVLNQLAAVQRAAQVQAQQGNLPPQVPTGVLNMAASMGRGLSPQPQSRPSNVSQSQHYAPLAMSPGRPVHGSQPTKAAAPATGQKSEEGGINLSKWFGNAALQQQLPAMPPLPKQDPRVVTVDEIERRQQAVTH